jgi:hypothetical protein
MREKLLSQLKGLKKQIEFFSKVENRVERTRDLLVFHLFSHHSSADLQRSLILIF